MKITNKELQTQATEILDQVQSLGNYAAIIRSMDNTLYEVSCMRDVIADDHPKAGELNKHIEDLISLTAILLSRYESDIENLSDIADGLSVSLLEALA